MIQLLQSHFGTLAAVAVIGGLLLVVNYGGAVVAWFRRPKTSAAWPESKPAPEAWYAYVEAVEAASDGLDDTSTLQVLRGGLCPHAARVVRSVKG